MNDIQRALYEYFTHVDTPPSSMSPEAHAMYERQLRERLVREAFLDAAGNEANACANGILLRRAS